MPARPRRHLSYADIMATIGVFLGLGGSAYAVATGSVGSREITDNAVRSADIKNNDVRGRDIRDGTLGGVEIRDNTLSGADIRESTLQPVPSATTASRAALSDRATRADAADVADHATRADAADRAARAELADSISAPEDFHAVGAPGEPAFGSGCANFGDDSSVQPPVGFYKDREGVVHLQGVYGCTGPGAFVFNLPAGYRPAASKVHTEIVACFGAGACADAHNATLVQVLGSRFSPATDGAIFAQTKVAVLDGINFRAAS